MGLGAQSVQSAQPLLPCSPSKGPRFTGIVSPPRARRGCTASSLGARRVSDRSGCARDSSSLLAPASRSFSSSVSLVLRPFAPAALPAFFATPASADLPSTLAEEISPGKLQNLSPRAAWLYPMRLDDQRQLAARTRPHCQFVFLRSKICYALLSASPRGYALRFATVAVIGSDWLLSSN